MEISFYNKLQLSFSSKKWFKKEDAEIQSRNTNLKGIQWECLCEKKNVIFPVQRNYCDFNI